MAMSVVALSRTEQHDARSKRAKLSVPRGNNAMHMLGEEARSRYYMRIYRSCENQQSNGRIERTTQYRYFLPEITTQQFAQVARFRFFGSRRSASYDT